MFANTILWEELGKFYMKTVGVVEEMEQRRWGEEEWV